MSNRTHVFHNTPEWLQHTNPHKRSVESLTARCEAALSCVSVSTSFTEHRRVWHWPLRPAWSSCPAPPLEKTKGHQRDQTREGKYMF